MATGTINQPPESLMGNIKIAKLKASSNTTSDTFVVGNNGRHFLVLIDTLESLIGIYSVAAYGSGGVQCFTYVEASGITVDTSVTNRLTLTHSSRSIQYLDFAVAGNPLKFA